MSLLRKLLKLKPHTPPKLGRWQLTENNSDQQLRKIDLANCDSCGTCTPQKKSYSTDHEYIEFHLGVVPYHTLGDTV